jgi:ABC-type uncharacterized transport system auxiliary subunit
MMALCSASIAISVYLAACSVVKPPKRPEVQTFVLETPTSLTAEGVAHGNSESGETRVLRVSTMSSRGVYDTRQMAYTKGGEEIKYFAAHQWADPPPDMFVPILVAGLERTNRFPALVGPSSRAPGDLLLETELLSFRQEFIGSKHEFRASVRASILDAKNGRILGSPRTFEVVEPMEEANPDAGVQAAGRAAAKLAEDIARYAVETTEASAEPAP